MKQKVSVIGIGRLGLSFALLVNSKGYDVIGCDVNEKYIDSLNDRTFSSNEPHINGLLKETSMRFTTDAKEAFEHSDIIFVFVQTPSKVDGEYDHKYIDQIVSKIERLGVKNKTLVIGCTVMPYYCGRLQDKLSSQGINVVYNPEFIAQGSIVDGLVKSDMVLIGGSGVPSEIYQLYHDIMDKEPVFKTLSLTGAGIAKIAINCFLTMKIAYANLIGEIIISSWESENMDNILDAIGSDSRVGNKFLGYGFPAGGVCLPRDQKALNKHAYAVGVHTKFMQAIDIENDGHLDFLLRHYKNKNPDKNIPFIFSSLSYKKGVDILTHSYQLKLCIEFLRAGYKVDVPINTKELDVPDEFKDYCYNDMVTFGGKVEGYKIN